MCSPWNCFSTRRQLDKECLIECIFNIWNIKHRILEPGRIIIIICITQNQISYLILTKNPNISVATYNKTFVFMLHVQHMGITFLQLCHLKCVASCYSLLQPKYYTYQSHLQLIHCPKPAMSTNLVREKAGKCSFPMLLGREN